MGVDAARALALVGMITMHTFPASGPGDRVAVVEAVISGRAAALFAVLAGVGIALGTGGRTPLSGPARHGAAAGLFVRATVLSLLGLILHFAVHPPVAVILYYYGVLFLAAIPLLGLRPSGTAALAAVWCLAGPVASHLIRSHLPSVISVDAPHSPLDGLTMVLVVGHYPVLAWMTYVLVGLAVGRLDLGSVKVCLQLVAAGAALAVLSTTVSALLLGPLGGSRSLALADGSDALHRTMMGTTPTGSWWWLCVTAPHSSTPFDLAHTTGTSLMIVGLCLLLARRSPRVIGVLAAVGSIPLTLYTTHIIVLGPVHAADPDGSVLQLIAQLGVVVVVTAVVRLVGRRGPLETMLGTVSGAVRSAVADVSARSGPGRPRIEPDRGLTGSSFGTDHLIAPNS